MKKKTPKKATTPVKADVKPALETTPAAKPEPAAKAPEAAAAPAAPAKAAEPVKAAESAKSATKAPAKAKTVTKAKAPAKAKTATTKTTSPAKAKAAATKTTAAKTSAAKKKTSTGIKEKVKKLVKPRTKAAAVKTDFDSIIADLKSKAANYDASSYQDFLAIQVSLTDLGRNLYVEIKDGKLAIEPYEYNDRQANLIMKSANFVKMINGELDGTKAFLTGRLKIDGNIDKAKELSKLLGKK